MKKIIVITGGAGFVGSNLIKYLLKRTNYNLISIDNYFSSSPKNHFKSKRIKYLKGNTKNINKLLPNPKKIHSIFHFGEFSRIYQSFKKKDECFRSNIKGTHEVIKFCLNNKIKIIYSATSASLGKEGNDQNLSPYAFTKSTNMNLMMNLNEWFGLKYEIVYFYNVYGPNQIKGTNMAAVIGIFENCFKNNKPLPIVLPGTQTRRFTHVKDTVNTCYKAWKLNRNSHYSISSRQSYSINQVATFFSKNKKYIPERMGERFKSTIIKKIRNKKITNFVGNMELKVYIKKFKENYIG